MYYDMAKGGWMRYFFCCLKILLKNVLKYFLHSFLPALFIVFVFTLLDRVFKGGYVSQSSCV